MNTLLDKIKSIELSIKGDNLLIGLDKVFEIILSEINQHHKTKFKEDFELFKLKGRYWIFNTFAGGIIFLREPETIEAIKIDFRTDTNSALAEVEYATEFRNERNIKYKPNAGKVESTVWNMLGILPNFYSYDKEIKIALMALIAKMVKTICEDLNQNSWFMKYEKDFELEMILNNEKLIKLPIKAYQKNNHQPDE